jgi:hypothetical protein
VQDLARFAFTYQCSAGAEPWKAGRTVHDALRNEVSAANPMDYPADRSSSVDPLLARCIPVCQSAAINCCVGTLSEVWAQSHSSGIDRMDGMADLDLFPDGCSPFFEGRITEARSAGDGLAHPKDC